MKIQKRPLGIRFLLWFLSLILGCALLVTALATSLIADARLLTSANSLQSLIEQIITFSGREDTASVPQKGYMIQPLSYTDAQRMDTSTSTAVDSLGQNILDTLYDSLKAEMGDQLPLSKEEMGELVEQSTLKDYLSEKTAGMVSDFIRGEATTTIEPEEIQQLIEENQELIEKVIGGPLPQEYKDQIVNWVEENETVQQLNKEGIVSLVPAPDEEPNPSQGLASSLYQVNEIMVVVRSAISVPALLGSIGACVLLIALILLCNWGYWGIGLRRCGYPLLLVGLLLIPCLFAQFIAPPSTDPIIKVIWQVAASLTVVYGVIFALGLVFIISGIVVAHLQKKALLAKNAPMVSVPLTAAPIPQEAEAISIQDAPAEEAPTFEE